MAAPTDQLASMMTAMHGLAAVDTPRGEPVSTAVVVDGRPVGAVMLRFPTQTLAAERHVRDALARTALLGVLLAAGVALVVATRRDEHAVVLDVTDTGPGIADGDLAHVFERFWRSTNGTTTSGSGIGLAVVAELTAAHHGTVAAASVPGGGARFTVTLPRRPADRGRRGASAQPPVVGGPDPTEETRPG